MKVVGLTGGIGSGKTTVARIFAEYGVPVYIADEEAKRLLNTSKVLRKKLIRLFGKMAYIKKELNRPYIASKIFNDKSLLEQMNAIVHPKVGKHFKKWLNKQEGDYVIKEVAIIYEQQMESQFDWIVLVTADKNEKIKRIISRDHTTKDKIEAIMNNQLSDEVKIAKADFVITNNNMKTTVDQVWKIHHEILKKVINSKF